MKHVELLMHLLGCLLECLLFIHNELPENIFLQTAILIIHLVSSNNLYLFSTVKFCIQFLPIIACSLVSNSKYNIAFIFRKCKQFKIMLRYASFPIIIDLSLIYHFSEHVVYLD